MSTSDEKMMEDAINMANQFASQNEKAQMVRQESLSDKHSDADSGSDSPRLISKLKASIKRSPKRERKRTFSDSLNQEAEDDVPPEAQEAYNMLVVHGSVKEGSRGYHSAYHNELDKRESLASNGSAGHNFAYADSTSSSISRTPDRESPVKTVSRHSSERSSVSPSNLARVPVSGSPDRPTPKPRPDAPPPTLPKRGEIPVPKPRPEIQRVEPTPRPLPPPVPTKDFGTPSATTASSETASNNAFDNPLLIQEEEWKQSEESLRSDRNSQHLTDERADSLNTSSDSGRKSTSPSDVSQSSASKFSFFEEEFDQPSPREIMSKLARESRLRRSLDHQTGTAAAGDAGLNRNLREPQGIPGKTLPAALADEEEVDTNPLRMLRGGVITVRGGRGGSGMSSNKPTLRHPKLHFSTGSSLQHSASMDAGRDRNAGQSQFHVLEESENEPLHSGQTSPPPALPPRSFSICDTLIINNPLPLPPRNPRRTVSLNIKPRERKYPLMLDDNTNSNPSTPVTVTGSQYRTVSQSVTGNISERILEDSQSSFETKVSDLVFQEIILQSEKYAKPLPKPEHVSNACNMMHVTDSSSLADLPLAPPPPYKLAISMETDADLDDNVFETPVLDNSFSSGKNVNLSSEGGASGAATFPRGFKLFGIKSVKCNLEQLGFYNLMDPFWVKSVIISDQRSYSEPESDISPLMLANYKCSEGVSYEDLLDFALDR